MHATLDSAPRNLLMKLQLSLPISEGWVSMFSPESQEVKTEESPSASPSPSSWKGTERLPCCLLQRVGLTGMRTEVCRVSPPWFRGSSATVSLVAQMVKNLSAMQETQV